MGRGLSKRQKRLLALLVLAKRPLDLMDEATEILDEANTRLPKCR
jgi:ABC-type transport system involved in cytochrome c biogenesis ATPase subunit